MSVVITGGLGYIGSHIVAQSSFNGDEIIIVDNLSNTTTTVLARLKKITKNPLVFYSADIRDKNALKKIFHNHNVASLVHCAGLKSVSESFSHKSLYFDNNVNGSKILFDIAINFGVKKIVFSSSAAVYGNPLSTPVNEDHPLKAESPYGQNKIEIEMILKSLCDSNKDLASVALRYFNPIGSHDSLLIGENSLGTPTNIFPLICKVGLGESSSFSIFGDDYNTLDGTCIRDYIHVQDLADGHRSALDYCQLNKGFKAINLGRGEGVSVKDLLTQFEIVTGNKITYHICSKRPGDPAEVFAANSIADKMLGWKAKKTLRDMISDGWAWEQIKSSKVVDE